MCGIGGIINSRLGADELETVLRGLARDLDHRGPDDRGFFVSEGGRAGLVNTRLAILGLGPAGHQPMQSADGRYTIVFNGEIYNFEALRAELLQEGCSFRSRSDTEVVLRLFERDGPDSVRELTGMFAIAIWDEQEKSLFLARDPLGIKPLYYFTQGNDLVFASEIRALLGTGLVPRRLCTEAVRGYLLWGAVQDPLTLVEGTLALPAGHYLIWRSAEARLTKFWDVEFGNAECGMRNAECGAEKAQAAKIVREALDRTIERHFVSDVPVGVFLSGGIDSTAVLALAAARGKHDLRTFSISFDHPTLNEGDVAARTARHFGARHTDWRMEAPVAKKLLATFLASADQPGIDGFNTFCVSKLAHDHGLKVVLSGLGGDELFGGYGSFRKVPQMVGASRWLAPVRPMLRLAGGAFERGFVPARYQRLVHFAQEPPVSATAYWAMRGIFTPAEMDTLLPQYGGNGNETKTRLPLHVPPQPTIEDEVSYLELTRYMRNQLLRDSDVMSMAWGLELRVPFVDSALVDAVRGIPAALRLAAGKRILLDAIPEIPDWVRNRPKQGFTFPFGDWVTGEWSDVFHRIEAATPIRLGSWYRRWCLLALETFIEKNGMVAGEAKVESGR